MDKKTTIITTVIAGLVLFSGYFGYEYFALQRELKEVRGALNTQKTNEQVIDFSKLFIETVLKSEGEVNFETRLKLENMVRDLKDEEILAQWQKFIESKTEFEAQREVKNLLSMLVSKIRN